MRFRLVQQKNRSSGCGPACVAMVARVSYDRARRAMFDDDRETSLWSEYPDLRRALKALGCRAASRGVRSTSFEQASEPSIFACKWREKSDSRHWVLYDPRSRRIYDPARPRPIPLTPAVNRRYRPHSRMTVHPTHRA